MWEDGENYKINGAGAVKNYWGKIQILSLCIKPK